MDGTVDLRQERQRIVRARRAAAALVGLALALGVGAFLLFARGDSEAEASLRLFLDRFEAGEYVGAAELTDRPGAATARALEANVIGLDGAKLSTEVVELEESDGAAGAVVAYAWSVPGVGEFAYENPEVELVREDDRWLVRWRADAVHPALDSKGSRLGTSREFPERAPIVDREGSRIVQPRPVVEIGIVPAKADDVGAAIAAITSLTEADPKALRASVEAAASPRNFVPAITLRQQEFAAVSERLDAVPGIEFGQRELPLAPTKEFARALLGTVAPITAEQLEQLGDPYAVGDNVGQSGLQLAFERRLAGLPERAVITRLADGTPADALLEIEGERGRPLRTTLDGAVQVAAEEALGDSERVSALVAIEPSSGDVLAAASRPADDAFNRAFEGRYPPGSTFKVITTEALLGAGLDPDETVDCPPTIIAGGRSFRNFEGSAAGAVPFRVDFAESCNTAFISLAGRLGPSDLGEAAARFGVGSGPGESDFPPNSVSEVPMFLGRVPVTRPEVEQAASMIGQGEILASPVAMAGVAATVIDGRYHRPRVLASDPRKRGRPLDPGGARRRCAR